MPKISVITPVYKVENYLRKCVDSILGQTFKDFELIIVDDGSPDNCGTIADEYSRKDSRVRVIHKENGGAPSARNAGMEIAEGEYFYFPDSDDWLELTYLQELYDLDEKTGAEMVISGFVMEYYEDNRSMSYSVKTSEAYYDNQKLVRENLHQYFNNMMMAVPWNKLYRASYINEHKLRFPDIKWDDLHFNMDVIKDIEKVAISSSDGYHFFRSRPGSETTIVFDEMLYKKRKEQFRHILSVYKHWGIKDRSVMATIYGYYSARLVQCIQEIAGSNSKNKKALIKEILDDPLTEIALKRGRIESKPLAIAAVPMKAKNIYGCIAVGNMIGFVKKSMPSVFYRIKSRSVNKASE